MSSPTPSSTREAVTIILLSVVLALVYNAFSSKPLPLIRVEPKKEPVSDSALFSSPTKDTAPNVSSQSDTGKKNDIKVIAPLHERALHNPDSMEAVVKAQRKKEETVFKIITLNQLRRLLASGKGILMDARNEEDYVKGHIKGARSIPGLEPEKHFEELVHIPRDTLVIIYCNNAECHLGSSLAEFMSVMEFKNMVLYDDGWDGWVAAKMPIDSTVVPR